MSKQRSLTYRFSWFRLGNWKNFLKAELPLQQRVFLVGPNASGKSNLDPACTDDDIVRLRELHAEMDRAILACYGWDDVDLRHDFYPNDRGQMRFTVAPEARRELLRRLVELNLKLSKDK